MIKACNIPTDAEELCTAAVNAAPARIPSIGLENIVRNPANSGDSANGATAPLINSIPIMSRPNPNSMEPRLLCVSFLINVTSITPAKAKAGANASGFRSCINRLSPLTPVSERIQEVAVVPIFAPIITPTACSSFIIPEFTKPTTITVVADEDWITAVTPAPSSTAVIGLDVAFSRKDSIFPLEAFDNPCPITCIPYKNMAIPPRKDNQLKIVI